MFFSGHKKQGKEVGTAIRQTLEMGINSAEDLISGNRKPVPKIALIDPYVAGFITYFTVTSMAFVYKGSNWKNSKRMEFIVEAWKEIGLEMETIQVYARVMGDPNAEAVWDKEGQYSEGKDAAHLAFGAAYGILSAVDLQSEIVVQAREHAAAMMEIDSIVGQGGDNASLGAAVTEITIHKHMQSHYSGKLI